MKTIYKFPIFTDDVQKISVPKGAKILCVQNQFGTPCVWAVVDPNEKRKEDITVHTFGTGHPIENYSPGGYIGTYQLQDGGLVFHVFNFNN